MHFAHLAGSQSPCLQLLKKNWFQCSIIQKVSTPTEWCASMVPVWKKNGQVQICIDLTQLNKSVLRERHPLPAVEQVLAQLSGAKVFTKLDANLGFFQIPLAPECLLTTFITPFGHYCFCGLPFWHHLCPLNTSSSKCPTSWMGCQLVYCALMDDILIFSKTQEEHDTRLKKVLKKKPEAEGLTLNTNKCQFSVNRVTFLGQTVDSSSYLMKKYSVSYSIKLKILLYHHSSL